MYKPIIEVEMDHQTNSIVHKWLIPNPMAMGGSKDEDRNVKWWYHNEEGPAIIEYDMQDMNIIRCKAWLQYNRCYRLDGPSHEYYDRRGNVVERWWHFHETKYSHFEDWLAVVPVSKEKKIELKLKYG